MKISKIAALCIFFSWMNITFAQQKIIFDTDMGSDCDDAGALAVLHKLADKEEIEILGVIFSSNANPYGIGVCAAINQYYGRPDIPLGQYQGIALIGDPNDSYSRYIALAQTQYGHQISDKASRLVSTYKKILEVEPDGSVTIITVGHPVGLFYLMNDSEGKILVEKKVKKWIAMTHTDTTPQNDWNFGKNGTAPYIAGLLKIWPTEIYFSGAGKDIITGNVKLPKTSSSNPVKKAYELWGNNALKNGRSSWDQIAVLFAARPQYFNVHPGKLIQNNSLETYWKPASDKASNSYSHFKVIPSIINEDMEAVIEELMSEKPLISINQK